MTDNAFDLDDFIRRTREAARQPDARARVKALLEETVSDPERLAAAMPAFADDEDGTILFEDDTVSIWHCRFPVGTEVPAHDHQIAATIAVYRGAERNSMWKSDGEGGLEKSGEVIVGPGDVYQIGPSGVHSVGCASAFDCLGIHVYLGNLSTVERSLFDIESGEAMPFDDENYQRLTRTI